MILISVLETGPPGIAVPPGATITSRSAVRIRINFWRMVGLYNSSALAQSPEGDIGSISPSGDWANALECWRSPSSRLVIPGIAVSPGVTHSYSHHRWHDTFAPTSIHPSRFKTYPIYITRAHWLLYLSPQSTKHLPGDNRIVCSRAVDGPGFQRAEPGRAGPGRHSNFLQRAGHQNGPGRKIQARPIIGKQVATKNKRWKLRIMRLEF